MKLPRMKPGDLLVIKLLDLTSNSGWLPDDIAQDYPASECAVCGWYVNHDKEVIRITDKVVGDGDKTITVIPKGFLKSVKVVPYDRGKE